MDRRTGMAYISCFRGFLGWSFYSCWIGRTRNEVFDGTSCWIVRTYLGMTDRKTPYIGGWACLLGHNIACNFPPLYSLLALMWVQPSVCGNCPIEELKPDLCILDGRNHLKCIQSSSRLLTKASYKPRSSPRPQYFLYQMPVWERFWYRPEQPLWFKLDDRQVGEDFLLDRSDKGRAALDIAFLFYISLHTTFSFIYIISGRQALHIFFLYSIEPEPWDLTCSIKGRGGCFYRQTES